LAAIQHDAKAKRLHLSTLRAVVQQRKTVLIATEI
jgi:hypothetical protein